MLCAIIAGFLLLAAMWSRSTIVWEAVVHLSIVSLAFIRFQHVVRGVEHQLYSPGIIGCVAA